MNSLRLWVLILAATSFAAGVGAGVFMGELRAAQRPRVESPERRSEDYRRLFLETFELGPERERLFTELLRRYDEDLEEVRLRALEAGLSQVEEQLARLGLRYRDAIRNDVLPEGERSRFDELAAQGTPPPLPF